MVHGAHAYVEAYEAIKNLFCGDPKGSQNFTLLYFKMLKTHLLYFNIYLKFTFFFDAFKFYNVGFFEVLLNKVMVKGLRLKVVFKLMCNYAYIQLS